MMIKSLSAVAAVAVLASPATGQTLLSSFEDASVDASGALSGDRFQLGDQASSAAISTVDGVTDGLQALTVTADTNGFNRLIQTFGLNDPADDLITEDSILTLDVFVELGTGIDPAQGQSLFVQSAPGFASEFSASLAAGDNQVQFLIAPDTTGLIIGANNFGAGSSLTFDNISIAAVPEPASLALLGLGGLALMGRRRG